MAATFTSRQAIALSKIIPLAVGGSDRPGLAPVRFGAGTDPDTVRIDMTDGYTAFRVDVTGAGSIMSGTLIYGKELAKALGDAAKGAGKAGTVTVTVGDVDVATVTGGGVSILVPTGSVDFPSLDSFMNDTHPTESGAHYSPTRLGNVAKAAAQIAGVDGLVTVETVNPTKPARFTATGENMEMTAVLMPCRK